MKTDEPTLKVMTAALKEIEEADSDSSHFTSSWLLGRNVQFFRPLLYCFILFYVLLASLPMHLLVGLSGLLSMEYIILTTDYHHLLQTQPAHIRHRYRPKSRLHRLYHHCFKNNKTLRTVCTWMKYALYYLFSLIPTSTLPSKRRLSKPSVKLRVPWKISYTVVSAHSMQALNDTIKDQATIRTNLQDTLANVHTIKNKIQTV